MTNIFGELEKYVADKTAGMPEEPQQHNPGRGFAGEFVNSLAYQTFDPIRAVTQTVDSVLNTKLTKGFNDGFAAIGVSKPEAVEFGSGSWAGQNLGGAIGMLPGYFAARGLVGNRAGAAFDRMAKLEAGMAPSLAHLSAREGLVQATSGLFYGSLLRSTADENIGSWKFLTDRGAQGLGDAAIFGSLGLSTPGISRGLGASLRGIERATSLPVAQFAGHHTLINRVGTGLIAAAPAGLMAAEVGALKDGRWVPTMQEIGHSTASMAFVGGTLGAGGWVGAQRPGTYSTNGRWVTDNLGLTTKSPADAPATFRITNGQAEFNSFVNDLARGNETAKADVTVQPRLNTVASAMFGPRFGKWGEAQTISLQHRGLGNSPTAAELINADLVATCAPLEGAAVAKDVMPSRTLNGGDGQVFVQRGNKPNEFVISREPINETTNPQAAREAGNEAIEGNEAYALGKGVKRTTGPSTRHLESKVDVMGQELASGAIRMNFDAYGDRLNSNIGAATISSIGLTANGWPYFEVGVGLKSWTLNGEPLQPGRNYLDIKGNDVLNYNGVLNLRLTPGAKNGKVQTLELRAEHLLPAEMRGLRDVNADIFLNGQKFEPNTEVPVILNGAKAGAEGLPGMVRALAEMPASEGFFVGRRADGRLYFRADGSAGKALINGKEVPIDAEVPFSSSDHVTLPNGIKLRLDNYGPPQPEPPPREAREPRAPREPREPREPRSEEGTEPVTLENGDVVDPRTGIVLKEGTGATNEGTGEPTVTVDTSGPVPVVRLETEGAPVEPPKVDPVKEKVAGTEGGEVPVEGRTEVVNGGRTEVVNDGRTEVVNDGRTEVVNDGRTEVVNDGRTEVVNDGRTEVVNDGRTEVVNDGRTEPVNEARPTNESGVELPQKMQGPGDVKLQPHKDVRQDTWTPTMDGMLAKAERVQLADGSWMPRFKSEADARTAARYFAKQLQANRSEHVRFGHGQVKDGFTPMADFDGAGSAAITFRTTADGQIWLGVTGADGKTTDMVPYKKPAEPQN